MNDRKAKEELLHNLLMSSGNLVQKTPVRGKKKTSLSTGKARLASPKTEAEIEAQYQKVSVPCFFGAFAVKNNTSTQLAKQLNLKDSLTQSATRNVSKDSRVFPL